jgi:predicted HTH domain antitoxin
MPSPSKTEPKTELSREFELARIVSLDEAARLRNVSVDTLMRHERDRIIRLSPRRLGMRLKDALAL